MLISFPLLSCLSIRLRFLSFRLSQSIPKFNFVSSGRKESCKDRSRRDERYGGRAPMPSSRRPPTLRQQLWLLRQPGHHESLFQMLQRYPFEGTTRSLHQIHHRNRSLLHRSCIVVNVLSLTGRRFPPCSADVDIAGGCSGCGELGSSILQGGSSGGATEPMRDVQKTGGLDGVQVQMRCHVLRGPQIPGETRM